MKLSYNGFEVSKLGEFTISQGREFEEGQRAKVTLRIGVTLLERGYADNYSLVQQLKWALRIQNAVLTWTNTDTSENYLNQMVTLQSDDLPEEWGTYQMQFNMVFTYYEQSLVTSNLPLTFTPTGGKVITLGNVMKFSESATAERFSPYHSQRSIVKGEVTVSGLLLADTTHSLDSRRTALAKAKETFMRALVSADGLLQFGVGGSVFNRVVRPERPQVEVDQLLNAVAWSFTASYTAYPDEKNFATVEYQADQRDPQTGELFLTVSGKVTSGTEAAARVKLEALRVVALRQYGYDGENVQKVRDDATPHQVSANGDGDTFTELSFSWEYKRWRADLMTATFTPAGGVAVDLGNVGPFELHYSARRFSELHSARSRAGGHASLSGTWTGGRDKLLSKQGAMYAGVNAKEGVLRFGTVLNKTVRIEDFVAKINQAYTGIDWSCTATWSEFPNESGYATVDYTVAQTSDVESGDEVLHFAGTILAPDEAAGRAKLASLRGAMLAAYGYGLEQQLRPQSTARAVDANADGVAFIELTFGEEYRRRRSGLMNWAMQTSSRSDVATGLVLTTYSGHVLASGSTVDAAYLAALLKAASLANQADVLAQLGGNAFQRSAQVSWEQRQSTAENVREFVRLTFAYEYQSKLPAGQAYLEVNTDVTVETFGQDTVNVSGFVTAADFATAEGIYKAQVRSAYDGSVIRGERTDQAKVMAQVLDGSYTTQQLRYGFQFSAFRPKDVKTVNYRYGISVSNDYLSLTRTTRVSGSVYAGDEGTAAANATALLKGLALGLPVRDDAGVDHEYTSASGSDVFIKYDFAAEYVTRITGQTNLLEMRVGVSVKYSGVRWVLQPVPRNLDGSGGKTIVQDGGLQEGSRTVRGSVSAPTEAAALSWARQQRALLVGDTDHNGYRTPPEEDVEYEFAPRVDGVVSGAQANVRVYRVNFSYGEILPNLLLT